MWEYGCKSQEGLFNGLKKYAERKEENQNIKSHRIL